MVDNRKIDSDNSSMIKLIVLVLLLKLLVM